MSRLSILLAALFCVALQATGVHAETYPQRTVKLILPYGAASGTDLVARLVADASPRNGASRW